jgi:hypothetical protein
VDPSLHPVDEYPVVHTTVSFWLEANKICRFLGQSTAFRLQYDHIKFLRRYICKMKVPLKIRTLMWFLHRKVLLRKYNLARGELARE